MMASKVINTFSMYNNQAKDYPAKEEFPASGEIPQHYIVMYPEEIENDYEMDVVDIISSSSHYMATGEFQVIPIITEQIAADDVVAFSQEEGYIKYLISPTNITRLDDNGNWFLHQIPTGEIALITQSGVDQYNAVILSYHYFYSIPDDTDDTGSNEDIQ